jgi:hypothetical protein
MYRMRLHSNNIITISDKDGLTIYYPASKLKKVDCLMSWCLNNKFVFEGSLFTICDLLLAVENSGHDIEYFDTYKFAISNSMPSEFILRLERSMLRKCVTSDTFFKSFARDVIKTLSDFITNKIYLNRLYADRLAMIALCRGWSTSCVHTNAYLMSFVPILVKSAISKSGNPYPGVLDPIFVPTVSSMTLQDLDLPPLIPTSEVEQHKKRKITAAADVLVNLNTSQP